MYKLYDVLYTPLDKNEKINYIGTYKVQRASNK